MRASRRIVLVTLLVATLCRAEPPTLGQTLATAAQSGHMTVSVAGDLIAWIER